ncbi:MAG: class II aldolase/adducin family protein [Candidatus Heimdallarchaeota archaeon]|nr:class II aldolase/adducin family protein [Candidatus Heimdallarchaeota archaeon]MDH5645943.1 class II aldolase/adducin family protein [Candidatus Heimdallarchaeota archaeon]
MPEEYVGVRYISTCLGSMRDGVELYNIQNQQRSIINLIQSIPHHYFQNNSGNVSYRIESTNYFVITGTAINLQIIDNINEFAIVTSIQDEVVRYYGDILPSSETPLHGKIYLRFPDINWIVHTHPPINLLNQLSIPSSEKYLPYGTFEVGEMVTNLLNDNHSVVLKDHGLVSVGRTDNEVLRYLSSLLIF